MTRQLVIRRCCIRPGGCLVVRSYADHRPDAGLHIPARAWTEFLAVVLPAKLDILIELESAS